MSQISDLNRHSGPGGSIGSATIDTAPYEPPAILYADDRRGNPLMDYFQTLARHRWLIVLFALCGILISLLVTLTEQPVYRARTSLDIQSVNSDFMNMKAVNVSGVDAATDEYVATQIKLLQSESLLGRTVQHLDAEPHPDFVEQDDLASRIELGLYLVRDKPIAYHDLLDDAAHHVTVKAVGATRLAEVTCDSWNAEVAAKFCNTLVEQFKQADLETRSAESQKTSEWLIKQVADVKAKAEEAERKLEAATGGNGLVLTQEASGVETDRLKDIQGEYVRAEADRMEKQALAGIGSATATPNLTQSDAYRHDEEQLSDLQRQVSALVPPLTEENEKVIHLRAQIKTVEADMAAQRSANAAHLKSDYQAAVQREAMQAGAYHRAEASVSADLGKAAKVALLRSDVQANQQLYQTLMQRAREAGFASALQASNIRVVDPAQDPSQPFSPRRGTSAASGLLLGTLCGIGFAFLSERVTTVFRMPGDTERYLGLRELGVIPSSVRVRKSLPIPLEGDDGAELLAPSETPFTMSNWTENFSIVAEAYRSASVSIMLSDPPLKQGRVYVISSPNAGEGKTTVVSNLGVALSKSGLRVLLIDGDLRKPTLHRVLQVPNDFGMRNLLRGEGREEGMLNVHYQPTGLPNLFVLPAGRGEEGAVELLHSTFTVDLIQQLRNEFDAVVIDTPPMLHMADARILASHAQGAILVIRAGLTSREQATRARDLFEQDGVRMVGTILNDFNPDKNGLSDYYESYSRYVHEVTSSADGSLSFLEWLFAKEEKPAKRRTRRSSSYGEAEEIVAYEDASYGDIADVDLAAAADAAWEPEILKPPPLPEATEPPRSKGRRRRRSSAQHEPTASVDGEGAEGGAAFEPPPTSAHYDPPPGVHYDPLPGARYEPPSAKDYEPPPAKESLGLFEAKDASGSLDALESSDSQEPPPAVGVEPATKPFYPPLTESPTETASASISASVALPLAGAEPSRAELDAAELRGAGVGEVGPIAASVLAAALANLPESAKAGVEFDPTSLSPEADAKPIVAAVETATVRDRTEPEPVLEVVEAAPVAEPYEPPPSVSRYEPPPPAVRGTVIVYEPPRKFDEPKDEAIEGPKEASAEVAEEASSPEARSETVVMPASEPGLAPLSEAVVAPTRPEGATEPVPANEAMGTPAETVPVETREPETPVVVAMDATPPTAPERAPTARPSLMANAEEQKIPLMEPAVLPEAAAPETPVSEAKDTIQAAAQAYEPPPPGAFAANLRRRSVVSSSVSGRASEAEAEMQARPDTTIVQEQIQPEALPEVLAEAKVETQPEGQPDVFAETKTEAQAYLPPAATAAAAGPQQPLANGSVAALDGLYQPPSGDSKKRSPAPAAEEEYQPPRRQPLPPATAKGQPASASNDLYAATDREYGQPTVEPEPALGFFAKLFQRGRAAETANGDGNSETHDPTQERRKGKRLEWPNLVAHYWDGGAPSAHEIRNISATGLYLLTEERWYPGTQVMMLLQKPGAGANDPSRSITVNAKVVRFGVDGLGFAFVIPKRQPPKGSPHFGANGADRATIQGFLQRRPRK